VDCPTSPKSGNAEAGIAGILSLLWASRSAVELELGSKISIGLALGVLPLIGPNPWGTNPEPGHAGSDAILSLVGGGANEGTAYVLAEYGSGLGAEATGVGAAAVGGYELGRAFNAAWAYYSPGGESTFGGWLYSVTHQ
jgi:hypothetical protein